MTHSINGPDCSTAYFVRERYALILWCLLSVWNCAYFEFNVLIKWRSNKWWSVEINRCSDKTHVPDTPYIKYTLVLHRSCQGQCYSHKSRTVIYFSLQDVPSNWLPQTDVKESEMRDFRLRRDLNQVLVLLRCFTVSICGWSQMCVLVYTVFCTVCTVFLYCFVYVYLFLSVLSVLVWGLLAASDNWIAVSNNNNNNKSQEIEMWLKKKPRRF